MIPTFTGAALENLYLTPLVEGNLAPCLECGRRTTRSCVNCGMSHYCSLACYRPNIGAHNTLCFSGARLSLRPTNHPHVRAIVFPDDDPHPRMVWLEVRDGVPLVGTYMGLAANAQTGVHHVTMVNVDTRTARQPRQPFNIFVRLDIEGTRPDGNLSVSRSINPRTASAWYGTLVVVGADMIPGGSAPKDLVPEDLKDIKAYLNWASIRH